MGRRNSFAPDHAPKKGFPAKQETRLLGGDGRGSESAAGNPTKAFVLFNYLPTICLNLPLQIALRGEVRAGRGRSMEQM
jgi:hypothetical protein